MDAGHDAATGNVRLPRTIVADDTHTFSISLFYRPIAKRLYK